MQNKLLELVQDRSGKLSVHKFLFLFSCLIFVLGWAYSAYHTKTIPPIDSSISTFLTVIGATQLGKSYLANKQNQPTAITNNNTTTK